MCGAKGSKLRNQDLANQKAKTAGEDSSPGQVHPLAMVGILGGEEAAGQLPWGRGRPEKPHGYTQQEIDVIVSP